MIQFERGKDPKESLNIGLRQKRIFKDIEEAADWCARFPDVYTDGLVSDWLDINPGNEKPFYDVYSGRINTDTLNPILMENKYTFGKLYVVKWIKGNLRLLPYPNEVLGLKECKGIVDRMEELIKINSIYKNSETLHDRDRDLHRITEFIEELKNSNYNLRETKGDLYIEGLFAACDYIKEFIEGLRL